MIQKKPVEPTLDVTALVSFALFRLSNSLGRLAEQDAQAVQGLSLPEYRCLSLLASRGDMTVTDVCAALRIDKAWVSRTLAKLKDKQLVDSRADPNDARRTVFMVTQAGIVKSASLIDLAQTRQAAMFEGVAGSDMQHFLNVLQTMQKNADKRAKTRS